MLRDMRGAGTDTSPHKFRVLQLTLNAVALLAITGALFAYFRANPAVQVSCDEMSYEQKQLRYSSETPIFS
jgi:hypothetical protein